MKRPVAIQGRVVSYATKERRKRALLLLLQELRHNRPGNNCRGQEHE